MLIRFSRTFLAVTASAGAITQRGSATFANNNQATLTINKPTGVVAGDVLIANFMAAGGSSITTVSATGWTLVQTANIESGGAQHTVTVLYRVADGTEGSSFTFNGPSGTNKMSGEVNAFSGVSTTGGVKVDGSAGGPFDVTPPALSTNTGGSTAVTAASITTASANAGVVMVVSAFDDAGSVGSYSAPNVTLTDLGYAHSGNGTVGAAFGVKSTAGATGAGSATLGGSQRWGAMLLALKPATGSANQLAFTTLPSNTTAGSTMSPSVVVQLKDQNGNNVSTSGVPIQLTLNTGSFSGTSTTTVNTDSSGKATFSNLQINTAGTYTMAATSSGWTTATSNSFTIAKATPVFSSLTASQSIPYGTSSVTLSGTVSAGSAAPVNGETVSVKINGNTQTTTTTGGNGSFSINFSTATIPASVTAYTIIYSYAGDSTLNAAADNTSTALTVNKASLTVTPDPQSRSYGQAVPSYTFSVTGFQNSENAGTASGYVAPSCTSDYTTATTVAQSPRTISCSGGSANNYSFNTSATSSLTVSKASLTVTPDPQSRSYGQAVPSYTFSVTGFQNSENAGTASGYVAPSCTSDYTTATTVAQSPRTISCSGGSANNYSFNTSATSSLTVSKASLTVTPDPQSRSYGQAVPSYTFSVTGFQNSENAGTASGYVAPSCTSDYTTATTVAQSPRTITCSGGSANNYSFNNSATANLTVTKATLTVTPDPQSRTYGQAVPSYTFSVTGFQNSESAGTASGYVAPSCTSDYTTATTVAQSPRTITCSGGSANNYSFNNSATANLTVTKATLTVTPDPQSRTYGQAVPSYTFSVTGFQNSESAGTASGYVAPSCTSDYTTATTVAQSPRTISCSGGSANNYSFNNSATANLTVTKATLTVTPDPQSRSYGQAVPSYTFSVTGFQNSENAGTASGYSSPSCTSDYTHNTTVAQSPRTISCSGGSADNYSFDESATANLTVSKASLTVTPDPQSRTYGQAAPSYTFSVTGFQNSENAGTASGYVAPSCTSDYTTTTTVAQSPRTISCLGGSANNYSFNTSATANLTVSKASLTVTPDPQSRMYGQAVPSYTLSVTGFQNSENAGTASGYVAPSCTSDYTTTTTVAQSPRTISCSGGSADNYSFDNSATANLSITKRALTITANNRSKIYGTSLSLGGTAFTTSGNEANSEQVTSVTLTSTSGNDASTTASVGTYSGDIVPSAATGSNGFLASNYNITYANGDLTITKATFTTSSDVLINGQPTVGTATTVTNGVYSPLTTSRTYQWELCNSSCAPIGGATGHTYTPVTGDVGSTLVVVETVSRADYNDGSSTSSPSPVVIKGDFTTSSAVAINGTPTVDTASTITAGSYSPTPTSSTYQWRLCDSAGNNCADIATATSSSYTPVASDAGSTLRVVETVSKSGYNDHSSTSASAVVVKGTIATNTAVSISGGTPKVGTLSTIFAGTYSPSPTGHSYQWESCSGTCSNIGGATSSSYTPVAGDVGLTLRVVETVTKDGYADGSSTSAASAAVVNGDVSTNTPVAINGTPTVGTASTLNAGSYSPTPASSSYQWESCSGSTCTNITGANASSYTPVSGDVGSTLKVVETVSESGYNNGGSTSAASPVVIKGNFSTTTAVAINGTPTVGTATTITNGVYAPTATTTSHQWELCDSSGASCSNIGSATGSTYTPVSSQIGLTLRVVETATRAGYNNGSSTSSAVVVKGIFATTTAVAINGTPTVGTKSTITGGTYSPTPSGRSYQWKRCDSTGNTCVAISGATYSTYTPVAADVGKTLRVVETVTKSLYVSGGSTSAASALVVKGTFVMNTQVAVFGYPKHGVTSSVTQGSYTPTPTARSYQWLRCTSTTLASCVTISGATANTYKPGSSDIGKRLRVVETVSAPGYNNLSVTSLASAAVT